jgi:hypothetical protein
MRNLLAATLCLLALPSPDAHAQSRDPDGSRIKARFQALGTTQHDLLKPPADAIDWRTFKITEPIQLRVKVVSEPAKTHVRVELTDGRGRSLAQSSGAGGTSLSHKLEPGLYYVSVSAST